MELVKKIYQSIEKVNLKAVKGYDLENQSPFYRYVIFGTGQKRQSDALIGYLKEELKGAYQIRGVEGKSSNWILIDCGDVIVHVFNSEEREFYQFDERFLGVKEIKL